MTEQMEVRVVAFGAFLDHFNNRYSEHVLNPETTIKEFLHVKGITASLIESSVIELNGEQTHPYTLLNHGDELCLFPPYSGG